MKVKKHTTIVCCIMALLSCNPPERHGSSEPADENEYYVEKTVQNNVVDSNRVAGKSPYVKFFVENSGSMDGYVNSGSDLRDLVQGYLYNVDMSSLSPSGLSCYFINDRVIPVGSDIENYSKKITPTQFKKSGGKKGTSDLADIFKKIIPEGDTIAFLVSDCIFSPGKADANHYVIGQYNQIKHIFHGIAERNNMSVLIYRFEGAFGGLYYDCTDKPSKFNGKRPFFLVAIGKDEHIRELRSIEDKLPVGIQNKCIVTHNTPQVRYAVLPSHDGYRVKHSNNHAIEKAKLTRGKGSQKSNVKTLTFYIGVDLNDLIANEQYLLDTANWHTDNIAYKVESVSKSNNANYTHLLKIVSTSNSKTSVDIMLKNKMPRWIYRFNNDRDGTASPTDSIQTTFGLKKMVMGIFDAYTDNGDNLCTLTISINQ